MVTCSPFGCAKQNPVRIDFSFSLANRKCYISYWHINIRNTYQHIYEHLGIDTHTCASRTPQSKSLFACFATHSTRTVDVTKNDFLKYSSSHFLAIIQLQINSCEYVFLWVPMGFKFKDRRLTVVQNWGQCWSPSSFSRNCILRILAQACSLAPREAIWFSVGPDFLRTPNACVAPSSEGCLLPSSWAQANWDSPLLPWAKAFHSGCICFDSVSSFVLHQRICTVKAH